MLAAQQAGYIRGHAVAGYGQNCIRKYNPAAAFPGQMGHTAASRRSWQSWAQFCRPQKGSECIRGKRTCTASQRRRFRGQERQQRWSKAPARNRAVSDLANGRAVQRRLRTWAVLNAIKIAKNANDITNTLRPYGSLPSLASMGYVAARRAIRVRVRGSVVAFRSSFLKRCRKKVRKQIN